MAPSRGGLKRLAKLYEMVEKLRSVQARSAASIVAEVDRTVLLVQEVEQKESVAARHELGRGSRVNTMAVEQTASANSKRRAQLEQRRKECVQTHLAAVAAYQTSRMELLQIEGVLGRMESLEAAESERRAQSVSDDRYLSRREWLRARENDHLQ